MRQLEAMLQNITYAQLEREDFERMGDQHFVILFRIAQLSIEYLIFTQNYLETLTKSLDYHYKQAFEEAKSMKSGFAALTEEN